MSPATFIPLAERSGLIGDVTEWAVKRAIADARSWADDGVRIGIGVNVPLTLLRPPTVARLLEVIDDAGIEPGQLTLEVTESATMANPEATREHMHRLRSSGVNLAIDDFGTGYSSLARLTQMPVTTLKIDRAFIRQVPQDESAMAVARTVIQLAASLGAEPLAEGIETPEQLEFLREQGCVLGQGFLFSRPVAAGQVAELQKSFRMNGHH